MKGRSEDKEHVMVGHTDWYRQAGRRPLREEGFTPELMQRIEAASVSPHKGNARFSRGKRPVFLLLASAFVICILIWQAGGINGLQTLIPKGHPLQKAAARPSSEPTVEPQVYSPPVGSAEFEFSGKKYYMPLPLDRDKRIAYAVETSQGILWSPAPHGVNYNKYLFFHPTEPRVLYLSSKENSELSATSATKVYSYPLFASDENTYNYVSGVFGVGDYAIVMSYSKTVGTKASSKQILSVVDVRKVVPGGTVVPRELFTLDDPALNVYRSLTAIDKQHGEFIMLFSVADGEGGYGYKAVVYDFDSGQKHELNAQFQIQESTVTYETDGEKRNIEIFIKTGEQWYLDWMNEEQNSR
ncbi:hypothetical protein [Paenibacillus wynnii]|uniref:hypothetical protein n=1 Tax=Paenibacillus wynnii TaxID=268407 RepID=UPI002790EA35|nr:hypothetical protein [Paenibacillus wynnii]MDQ0192685.1 hypothetical protein [Paenibacillus wynnii]